MATWRTDVAPEVGDLEVERGALVRAEPRVSVVIPAYRSRPDQPDWLDEALDSIRAQTFGDWEIVVVDDGSPVRIAPSRTDDLTIVRQPNTGPGGARNVGSVIARGHLIAFLDSDDRWRPEKLAKQVALHERRPELVLSATDFVNFDDSGVRDPHAWRARNKPTGETISFERLFFENCIACSSTMMPRTALMRTPGMARDRRMGEDYGLWLRIAMLGPIGHIDETLMDHRFHADSLIQQQMRDGSIETREREVYEEFLAEYPVLRDKPCVRETMARLDHEDGWTRMQRREWDEARRALLRSFRANPRKPKVWIDLARAVLRVRVG
jgi:glycosyltransferase involved in cell wall biosynthesis